MDLDLVLEGLFVDGDHVVHYTNYAADGVTPKDMAGWTIILDIRKKDTSVAPALLAKTRAVSGVFNVDPLLNTQVCLFTILDTELAATIFKGDDLTFRYSIKRTDAGAEQPLRYGDCPIVRVTQV